MVLPALASALTPLFGRLEAERAHRLAITALRLGLAGRQDGDDDPVLATRCLGLSFPNPIGLAAGFDKDGTAADALMRLGFGLVESGTVTLLPQPGNPRPRVFRLPEEQAVINRFGFNNAGVQELLTERRAKPRLVPFGVNIGINKSGADPLSDYPALVAAVAPVADYVVINVSSPNTPGLRDLQSEAQLRAILQAVADAVPSRPPLLVKLAPDLAEGGLEAVVGVALECGVDGLVLTNTTITRPAGLRGAHVREAGGLSGPPLFEPATAMLRRARRLAAGRLVLIGVGGVATGADAYRKIRAGADLVQLYTAFSYAGPALLPRLKRDLALLLHRDGFDSLDQAVGLDAELEQ